MVGASLTHEGVDVIIRDNDGVTAPVLASFYGHVQVFRWLLIQKGVDVNMRDHNGRTVLMCARNFWTWLVIYYITEGSLRISRIIIATSLAFVHLGIAIGEFTILLSNHEWWI